jgi:hypothetical protein
VTLAAYQQVFVDLLVRPQTARRVAEGDFGDADLTDLERERLRRQAQDAGVALTRRLHQGWRLTKLLTLLPLTFEVGDDEFLADQVQLFWGRRPPESLYFQEEAVAFAHQVAGVAPPDSLLRFTADLEAGRLTAALHAIGAA